MSTRSWFRVHRKQVVTHAAIIVGFMLLVIFVAEPLFDRMEAIPGEAQSHRLELPSETGGMRSHIDGLKSVARTAVEVNGWAFIEGEDSQDSKVYIVLKSPTHTYVFDAQTQVRRDVTRHFEELGLNLDYSGFLAVLPARRIADGEYTVGIYVTKGDVEALQHTRRTITKARGTIEIG